MKNIKTMITFTAAVGLSLLGVVSHFGDSAHSMALLSKDGGRVKHAAHFECGLNRYVMIATATVLPPYRGDVRVVVENVPGMTWAIHNSEPMIPLGLHREPVFRDHVLKGVQPRDRLVLWVVMRPDGSSADAMVKSAVAAPAEPGPGASCCPESSAAVARSGNQYQHSAVTGPSLAFYDMASGNQVMRVPIHFNSKEDRAE
ncbi:MAG: hypothetical protein RI601_00325 [Desulfurivibrionaceae bacterium]|nr:hypothetical protein [Desulfurivibrionaceae bacterium]